MRSTAHGSRLMAHAAGLVSAACVSLLAACGGGAADTGSRSGVSIESPLNTQTLAVAPLDKVAYTVKCSPSENMSYLWDPGNGTTPVKSTSPTFEYAYPAAGRYLPRVTCTDARGASTVSSANAYVDVTVPAHAISSVQATATAVPGAATTEATFSAHCIGSRSDSKLSYSWDFGDKPSATASTTVDGTAKHTYPNSPARQYTATVHCNETITLPTLAGGTVEAQRRVSASTTVTIDAEANAPKVTAPLSAGPYIPTTAGPTTFRMACSPTNGSTVTYSFDFGDGSPVQSNTTGSVVHTYEQRGAEEATQHTARATCQQGRGWSQAQSLKLGVRTPQLTLLAGQTSTEGIGANRLAVDKDGYVYATDTVRHVIYKISPSGAAAIFAGSGTGGYVDGWGIGASFKGPSGIAVDNSGNVYVADSENHVVRMIRSDGYVSTLAGNGTATSIDGQGAAASFDSPTGLSIDSSQIMLVTDKNSIRQLDTNGNATTKVKFQTGQSYSMAIKNSSGNIIATSAGTSPISVISSNGTTSVLRLSGSIEYRSGDLIRSIGGIALDKNNNIYLSSSADNIISIIDTKGGVSTIAGKTLDNQGTQYGHIDTEGNGARFSGPHDLAADTAGNIYIADKGNQAIRKMSPTGVVSTLISNTTQTYKDGIGADARLRNPSHIALDLIGNAYIEEILELETGYEFGTIKISPSGVLSGSSPYSEKSGYGLNFPSATATNSSGELFIAQSLRSSILYPDGTSVIVGCDASNIAVDSKGIIYFSCPKSGLVRMIDLARNVSTLASFPSPQGIGVDNFGNIYVADPVNHAIRRIKSTGEITTLAGSGSAGYANGTGTAASFSSPKGIAVDSQGNVYVADSGNSVIRKITPAGVVTTVAGTASISAFSAGALPSTIGAPQGIAIRGRRLVFTAGNYAAQIDFVP